MQEAKKGFMGGCFGCLGVMVAVVVVLTIIVVIIAVAVSGNGDKTAIVSTPAGSGQAQPIGTTQKVGDAQVTVHGTRESVGETYLQPAAGSKWVIVDISARNVGGDPYSLSSLLQCSMRDAEGRNYNITVGPHTNGSFDGTMPVGGSIRGEVVFEVPTAATGLMFIFGQSFGTGQAFWAVP
jgi:hypothetical protein